MARSRQYFTFHEKSNTDSNGEELLVEREISPDGTMDDCDIVVVEISGTALSGSTYFEAKATLDGDFYPIAAFKADDYSMSTFTNGKNELWIIDAAAFCAIRCRLSGISGGYINIKGRLSKYI